MTLPPAFRGDDRELIVQSEPVLELDTPVRRANRVIRATRDADAVELFLSEYDKSPNTRRTYEKELYRFLLWCTDYGHRRFNQLTREDMTDFEGFLQNPPNELVGNNRAKRRDSEWKPFRQPLAGSARHQALRVVAAFLDWLVQAEYVSANPMGLVRQKAPKLQYEKGDTIRPKKTSRHGLTEEAVETVYDWIRAQPRETPTQIEAACRNEMIFEIFLTTAARRTELSNATVNNLECRDGRWRLYVQAKGGDIGTLNVCNTAIEAIKRYRACMGLTELPRHREKRPLIAKLGNPNEGISDNMVYRLVKHIMEQSALLAAERGKDNIDYQLRQASTHWLRHTSISVIADESGSLRTTKGFGRHSSADTTVSYMKTEEDELHDNVAPTFDSLLKRVKK